jgi:hypothetical protein
LEEKASCPGLKKSRGLRSRPSRNERSVVNKKKAYHRSEAIRRIKSSAEVKVRSKKRRCELEERPAIGGMIGS